MLEKISQNLEWARKQNIVLPALNVTSHVAARAIVAAAEEENMPVVLQFDASQHEKFVTLCEIGPVLLTLAEHSDVPVSVHLDNARELEVIEQALHLGFNSVMFDASFLSYEEALFWSKKVRNLTRAYGASLEVAMPSSAVKIELPNRWEEIGDTLTPHTYSHKIKVLQNMAEATSIAWEILEANSFFSEVQQPSFKLNLWLDAKKNFDFSNFRTCGKTARIFEEDEIARIKVAFYRLASFFATPSVDLTDVILQETEADLIAGAYNNDFKWQYTDKVSLSLHNIPSIADNNLTTYFKLGVAKLNYYQPAAAEAGSSCYEWLKKMEDESNSRALLAHEIVYKLRAFFQDHYRQFFARIKKNTYSR